MATMYCPAVNELSKAVNYITWV